MPPKGQPSPGSGRKSKDANTTVITQTLTEAGKYAALIVGDYLRGSDAKGHPAKPISNTKLHACELAIAHAIGTPRQRVEIRQTGTLLTLLDLSRLIKERDNPELSGPEPELLAEASGIDVTPVEVKEGDKGK